jgi:hypothetical protein
MLSKMSLRCLGIAMAAFVLLAGPALADFKSLLGRIPSDANAIVLIDVERMLNSPLGVREGWKAKMANAYAQKPMTVPPDASRVVMAALIDSSDMEPIWELSVMDLTKAPSLDLMARAEGGYVDKLRQAPAVWSPVNAYFIQLDPLVLGVACPADRQFASRWAARKPASPGNSLSAYLSSAAGAVGAGAPIVLAMDLQDVTCATKVRRRLATETFASLEGKNPDLDALSQVFGTIKGVTLRVAIGQEATGKGVVDFDRDTAILASFAKPLLLELLSQSGALIDDFETWQVGTKGKQVSFEGKLSIDGLRCLLSVVEPPAPRDSGPSASTKPAASEKDMKVLASQQYFNAIRKMLQILDNKLRLESSATLPAVAIWMKRDASAISRMPILNVDPDLVKLASDLSVRLNDAARLMTEGTLQTAARTSGIRSTHVDSYVSSGGYYYTDPSARYNENAQRRAADAQAAAQRRQATKEEKARAVSQAGEIFKGLKAEAERIRIELTNRYQVEF